MNISTKNKTFLKTIRVALIVFALTFSSNMNAATPASFGGGIWEWIKELFNPSRNRNKVAHQAVGNTAPGQQGETDSVPLDGGLGILLLGAAAFGVKKLRESKNEEA